MIAALSRKKSAGNNISYCHLPQRGKEAGHISLGVKADNIAEVKEARGSQKLAHLDAVESLSMFQSRRNSRVSVALAEWIIHGYTPERENKQSLEKTRENTRVIAVENRFQSGLRNGRNARENVFFPF